MIIRCLTAHDIAAVVSIHLATFEQFFLTELGPIFLRQYYQCVLAYPKGIALGAFVEGEMAGFVTGFVNPPGFYSTLHSRRLMFALAAFPGLVKRPNRILRMIANYRRSKRIANDQKDQSSIAELSSLAVAKRANDTGIGRPLLKISVKKQECWVQRQLYSPLTPITTRG